MTDRKKVLVCLLLVALGVLVAVAGFMAEAKRVKAPQDIGEREYPSSLAMGIAIAAIVALVVARIIITLVTGGCCSPLPNQFTFARFCMLVSWFTFSLAVILFIAGAKLNNQKGVVREVSGDYYYYGVFSGAGIVGLLSVLFGLGYYLSYDMAPSDVVKKPLVYLQLQKPQITDDIMKPKILFFMK